MNYDSTNISTSTRKFEDMNSTVPKLRNDSKHISDIDSKIIPVLNEKKNFDKYLYQYQIQQNRNH